MWLAVAPSHLRQALAEIFGCAEIALRQVVADQMRCQPKLAAQAIAAARVLSARNIQSAPERAVLSGQNGKVGQRVQLIAACTRARREAACDLVGSSLLAPSVT